MRFCVLVLMLATGCSWIGVRVDANHPPTSRSECPGGAPVLDTVGAIVFAGVAVTLGVLAATNNHAPNQETVGEATVLVALPATASILYALSARYGWRARSQCRRLIEDHVSSGGT